jgi:hypothetical protein
VKKSVPFTFVSSAGWRGSLGTTCGYAFRRTVPPGVPLVFHRPELEAKKSVPFTSAGVSRSPRKFCGPGDCTSRAVPAAVPSVRHSHRACASFAQKYSSPPPTTSPEGDEDPPG